jgi:hypothetical protein
MEDKWIYVGIFLDEDSKADLMDLYPAPTGWKPYYDHMTVVFNDASELAKAVKDFSEPNLEHDIPLTVIGVGISEKAMAVKVRLPLGVICANKIAHVTLSVSPNGTPYDSNDIEIWHEVEPLELWGTMKVYTGKN